MTASLTPGAYLTRRREARGLSIEQVAQRLHTEPRVSQDRRVELIRLIEAGEQPATLATLVALRGVVSFDLDSLARLEAIAQGQRLPPPTLCRTCARSDDDPGDDGAWWFEEDDLCSDCAGVTAKAYGS